MEGFLDLLRHKQGDCYKNRWFARKSTIFNIFGHFFQDVPYFNHYSFWSCCSGLLKFPYLWEKSFSSHMIVELSVGYDLSDHIVILTVCCWSWRESGKWRFGSGLFCVLFNIFCTCIFAYFLHFTIFSCVEQMKKKYLLGQNKDC